MPRGPKGERRPADVIGNAVHVMRVLTGDEVEIVEDDGKDPAAKALGRKGVRRGHRLRDAHQGLWRVAGRREGPLQPS